MALSASQNGMCAVTAEGTLVSWGVITCFPDGGCTSARAPTVMPTIEDVASAVCADNRVHALLRDGSLRSWSDNHPSSRTALNGVVSVAAGIDHSCALTSSSELWCWGRNERGQLGDPNLPTQTAPVAIRGLPPIRSVAAGRWHTCVATTLGKVLCWGDEPHSAGGPPTPVPGLDNVTLVAGTDNHTCAVTAEGLLYCWGENDYGQLGDGSTTSRTVPMRVEGLDHVVAVTAGTSHTCAARSDDSVYCWGDDRIDAAWNEMSRHLRPYRVPISWP